MPITIIPARKGRSPDWVIKYDRQNPPHVFFDTNVWLGMGGDDVASLERLEQRIGFRYRYTVTNVAELASHLTDVPSETNKNPFLKYRACFQKILSLCIAEVLPSPEMEFLEMAGLSHYLDPVWIPNIGHVMRATTIVANASNMEGVAEIKPDHYRLLREADGASFRKVMGLLDEIEPPIRGRDEEKLNQLIAWFMKLANFFLLVRPSNKQAHYDRLTDEERGRFDMAFTNGAGKLFNVHCIALVKKRINSGKAIDPNDLYDLMQLLMLRNPNLIFVTEDRAFYDYQIDPDVQRFLPWTAFRASAKRLSS